MIKLRINQKLYYRKKKKFVDAYKALGLIWEENPKTGDGWYNKDKSEYLLKLPEKERNKRFYAKGVQGMVDFLKSIGAEDITEEDLKGTEQIGYEVYDKEFVGADVDSSCRRKFQEMLKALPDNFRCFYGDSLYYDTSVSEEFKIAWSKLQIKYANYTFNDFIAEIRAKNEKSADDNDVVEHRRKSDNDILPGGKKIKRRKVKDVAVKNVNKPVESFEKRTFKIKIKRVIENGKETN